MSKYPTPQYRIVKALLAGLLITVLPPIWADSSKEDACDKREDLMKDMGKHMKAIKKVLAGATDEGTVAEHANQMATLTNTLSTDLKTLFPVGSDHGDSQAKPNIWQNWAEFEKIAQSAATKGAALPKIVAGGDSAAIQSAYKELGDVCKSCHKDYRTEK
ncbi:Cytochrome c [Gammaproteobacteria bacterium]